MELLIEDILILIVFLLIVALLSVVCFQRLKIPYTIGLVIIGAAIALFSDLTGTLGPLISFTLSPEIILFLFLPPLIFESAYRMKSRLFFRDIVAVLVLTIPGIVISMLVVGGISAVLTPIPLFSAFLFGALISATDPVSVLALFEELGVSERLKTLVEGESLFNDATAIVLYNVVIVIAISGIISATDVTSGVVEIAVDFMGGIVSGCLTGVIIGYLILFSRDNMAFAETVSLIVAYASYLVAEALFGVSGVISVVFAGLTLGWIASVTLKPAERDHMNEFWQFAGFISNSLIFLLVGITAVNLIEMFGTGTMIILLGLAGVFAVLVGRMVVVYGLTAIYNVIPGSENISLRYQHVLFWGGLRGAVALALALALSIPDSVPFRDQILVMTIIVALFTILVQGSTIRALINRLNLNRPSNLAWVEYLDTRLSAKRRALVLLEKIHETRDIDPRIYESVHREYENAVRQCELDFRVFERSLNLTPKMIEQAFWSRLLAIQRKAYLELYDKSLISEFVLEILTHSLNVRYACVRKMETPVFSINEKPLETIIIQWIISAINRVAPHAKAAKNLRKFSLSIEYQTLISEAGSAGMALQSIEEMSRDFTVPDEILTNVRDVYSRHIDQCNIAVKQMAEKYRELAEDIEDYYLRMTLIMREEFIIRQKAAEGTIYENVRDDLLRDLEREKEALEKHVYNIL
ncbi:cation:proton antiporter [Methanogenium organophilum]|uniref:Sodium:proton antiporter n=1 Tax=Methanogenium organophilum TaxID=2199 RepID=A0A9X9T7R9_METOG|nr:sodium:proton antiporter [Methanogenium organophilum]WAI01374.1 sodium:proton antiporter [Methanogenium organophilum]